MASFASDLGVACGLAFAPDGTLFVGDRSGTIFKVDREGRATAFAALPPSVAAFHLALAPDGVLYVSAPTLSTYDAIYRIAPDGTVGVRDERFGRPQGIAFDAHGTLFVVEALAGSSGLYRLAPTGAPELVLAGPGLIGVAFDPRGGYVVCSNDTALSRCRRDVRRTRMPRFRAKTSRVVQAPRQQLSTALTRILRTLQPISAGPCRTSDFRLTGSETGVRSF